MRSYWAHLYFKVDNMIQVVAERIGYYGNEVKNVGEKFEVKSEQELGSWMSVNGKLWVKPVASVEAAEAEADAKAELELAKELAKEEVLDASDLI